MSRTERQINKDDQDLRDQVRSIDQTMREVILPTLNSVSVDVKSIVEKDYLTEAAADKRYAQLSDMKALANKVSPVLKGLAIVGGAIAATLVTIVLNFIIKGGLSK